MTSTIKDSSGTPLWFRSGTCNVPGQFRVGCIPGVLPSQNPFAQSLSNYEPTKPLFNASAFENPSSFNYYDGVGQRITSYRGFSFKNIDIGLTKKTKITERVSAIIRIEAFNAFNNHNFTCTGLGGCNAFNTDIVSADFGKWNGSVTTPRNVQLVGRIEF